MPFGSIVECEETVVLPGWVCLTFGKMLIAHSFTHLPVKGINISSLCYAAALSGPTSSPRDCKPLWGIDYRLASHNSVVVDAKLAGENNPKVSSRQSNTQTLNQYP